MSYEGSDMTLGRFSEAVDVFWIFLAGEQAENQEVLEDQKYCSFCKTPFFWELPYISILICILGVSFILDWGEHFLLWFRSESEYLSRKLLALAVACPKVINHQPILWRSAVGGSGKWSLKHNPASSSWTVYICRIQVYIYVEESRFIFRVYANDVFSWCQRM